MYVLDSDIVGHLQLGNPRLIAKIHATPDVEIFTTIVTKAEILRGRSEFLLKAADSNQLQSAQALFIASEEQLSDMPILLITNTTILELDSLRGQRGLGRIGRGSADCEYCSRTRCNLGYSQYEGLCANTQTQG
jgi:tRNA(fMet)-specific endonuclease VapC